MFYLGGLGEYRKILAAEAAAGYPSFITGFPHSRSGRPTRSGRPDRLKPPSNTERHKGLRMKKYAASPTSTTHQSFSLQAHRALCL